MFDPTSGFGVAVVGFAVSDRTQREFSLVNGIAARLDLDIVALLAGVEAAYAQRVITGVAGRHVGVIGVA